MTEATSHLETEVKTLRTRLRLVWDLRSHIARNVYQIANTVFIVAVIETLIYLSFFQPPWLSYPQPEFVVLTAEGEVPPPGEHAVYRPGQQVQILVERCNADAVSHIYPVARQLIGGPRPVILPSGDAPLDPGCTTSISSRQNEIPLGTPPGIRTITGYAEVNLRMRSVLVHWRSKPFEVVAP